MRRKSSQGCFFHEIEARFLFVDAFAEIFQKSRNVFRVLKVIFSLNVNLSLNLKNLIGVDLYQERIKLNYDGENCIYEGRCHFACSKGH